MMLPTVESAYRLPAVAPERSTSVSANRIANGETAPSSVTGTAKSASAATNDPMTTPTEIESNPRRAASRIGRAANGVAAMNAAATRTIAPSSAGLGARSASFPPSQYPSER